MGGAGKVSVSSAKGGSGRGGKSGARVMEMVDSTIIREFESI